MGIVCSYKHSAKTINPKVNTNDLEKTVYVLVKSDWNWEENWYAITLSKARRHEKCSK